MGAGDAADPRGCAPAAPRGRRPRRGVIGLSGAGALDLIAYGGLSASIAARRPVAPLRRLVVGSPADESLAYHAVAFRSRGNRLLLRGWVHPRRPIRGSADRVGHRAGGAHARAWIAPSAAHGQAYHIAGAAYVARVVALFATSMGPPGA